MKAKLLCALTSKQRLCQTVLCVYYLLPYSLQMMKLSFCITPTVNLKKEILPEGISVKGIQI